MIIMNKKFILLGLLLLSLSVLSPLVESQQITPQLQPLANYGYYINVTVPNWIIQAPYTDAGQFVSPFSQQLLASSVMIPISPNSIPYGSGYQVTTANGTLIPFTIIQFPSNGIFMQISNLTINLKRWSSARVYYNVTQSGGSVSFPMSRYIIGNSIYNMPKYYFFGIANTTNVIPRNSLIVVFNQTRASSFMVLTNRSLIGSGFNNTAYIGTPSSLLNPFNYSSYAIHLNSSGLNYKLQSGTSCLALLGCGTTVSGNVYSLSTNFTNLGLATMQYIIPSYLDVFGKTGFNTVNFVNWSTPVLASLLISTLSPNFRAGTMILTNYSNQNVWIVPSFTSNYNISAPISTKLQLNPCNFNYFMNFTNVTFKYAFSTVNGIGSQQTMNFNSNFVWYLNVTIPFNRTFPVNQVPRPCSNLSLFVYSDVFNAPINYSVASCSATSTGKVVLILQNKTTTGFTYKNFTIYIWNQSLDFNISNSKLINNYRLAKPNSFGLNLTNKLKLPVSASLPFIINLNHPVSSTGGFVLGYNSSGGKSKASINYNALSGTDYARYFASNSISQIGGMLDLSYLYSFSNPPANTNEQVNTQNMNLSQFNNYGNSRGCVNTNCNSQQALGQPNPMTQVIAVFNGTTQGSATYLVSTTWNSPLTVNVVNSTTVPSCHISSGPPIGFTTTSPQQTLNSIYTGNVYPVNFALAGNTTVNLAGVYSVPWIVYFILELCLIFLIIVFSENIVAECGLLVFVWLLMGISISAIVFTAIIILLILIRRRI